MRKYERETGKRRGDKVKEKIEENLQLTSTVLYQNIYLIHNKETKHTQTHPFPITVSGALLME